MIHSSNPKPRAAARSKRKPNELDDKLLAQIRRALAQRTDVVEKRMFGGVTFMVNGHMCCGALRGSLVLRLGEERSRTALTEAHVEAMDFTGKNMKSMVYVRPPGLQREEDVRRWVAESVDFALSGSSLPEK